MRTVVPDWKDRIKIGIKGGCVSRVLLQFDSSGNPIIPGTIMQQVYRGAFLNPNGNIMPANVSLPAIYYRIDPGTSAVTEWMWDNVGFVWIQSIA